MPLVKSIACEFMDMARLFNLLTASGTSRLRTGYN